MKPIITNITHGTTKSPGIAFSSFFKLLFPSSNSSGTKSNSPSAAASLDLYSSGIENSDPFNLSVSAENEIAISPLCLIRAKSKENRPTTSSLGPFIKLKDKKGKVSFALLYCAHVAEVLKNKRFYVGRLHKVDGLTAEKYHTFPEDQFHDLAVAHIVLPLEFFHSHLTKSKFKEINSANIGDEVRVISINNSDDGKKCKILAVNDSSINMLTQDPYQELIKLDVRGYPGDSGAPVISDDNEVIGIVVRTDENGYAYCNKLYDARDKLIKLFEKRKIKSDINDIYLTTK